MAIEIEDRYWVDKSEWQDYKEKEQGKKANRTTRTELDWELMDCPLEEREEKITQAFEKRLKDLKNSRILFVREDQGKIEYKIVKQSNRFLKSSSKNLRRKFQNLFSGQYAQGVFLTLTTWDRKFKTREEALNRIWSDFHKFKKQLDEYLKAKLPKEQRKNYKPLQYLACLEFNEKGYPHLHVCFVDLKVLAPKAYLKHLWYKYHRSYIVDVIGYRGVSVFSYIMKYFDKFQDLPLSLQALMWYGRKRFYNTSRRFYNRIERKVKKGYIFIACIKKEFQKELPRIFQIFTWSGATLQDVQLSLLEILEGG